MQCSFHFQPHFAPLLCRCKCNDAFTFTPFPLHCLSCGSARFFLVFFLNQCSYSLCDSKSYACSVFLFFRKCNAWRAHSLLWTDASIVMRELRIDWFWISGGLRRMSNTSSGIFWHWTRGNYIDTLLMTASRTSGSVWWGRMTWFEPESSPHNE